MINKDAKNNNSAVFALLLKKLKQNFAPACLSLAKTYH